MDNYIQVEDGEDPFYLPVENNNTVILETVQTAFPRCCCLCFYVKNKCFVVTLQQGIFHLPKEYWKFIFEPIFDEDYDDEDDDYDQEYFEHDRKNNVCGNPPAKEDISRLYYDMLNEKDDENDYSDDYDDS